MKASIKPGKDAIVSNNVPEKSGGDIGAAPKQTPHRARGDRSRQRAEHGEKLSHKQERATAVLLVVPILAILQPFRTDIEQVLREKKPFILRCMLDGIKKLQGRVVTMEQVRVERLDHLGLIASVIKDLGLIDMIDTRLVPDEQEVITPGEAVAGMILNGLGFANRPLSLTPQFFANKPLDLLFREGIDAEMFNRFKLGRTLDEAYAYGCDLLFQELALAVCAQEGIDLRFNHLDTTSFSLTGEYVPDSDEHAIRITHGYSKDHRPDLKQAVLELMVSQDGGVPFVSKSWDGNTSDTQVFQQRAEALMRAFKDTPSSTLSRRRCQTLL